MSELKARKANDFSCNWSGEWYKKEEADKVIAELKAQKAQAEDDCAYWKAKAQRERHHKFKRCLDKARICEEKSVLPYALVEKDLWKFTSNYWQRWHDRWLELADKFKEGK